MHQESPLSFPFSFSRSICWLRSVWLTSLSFCYWLFTCPCAAFSFQFPLKPSCQGQWDTTGCKSLSLPYPTSVQPLTPLVLSSPLSPKGFSPGSLLPSCFLPTLSMLLFQEMLALALAFLFSCSASYPCVISSLKYFPLFKFPVLVSLLSSRLAHPTT